MERICRVYTKNIPLKKSSTGFYEAIDGWLQEERDISLQLSRAWHMPIEVKLSRAQKSNLDLRKEAVGQEILNNRSLSTTLQSKGKLPDVSVRAGLHARNVICSLTINAPLDKARFATRANWLISQLGDSDPDLHIIAIWPRRIPDTDCSYSQLRDNINNLSSNCVREAPIAFRVFKTTDLAGNFSSRKKFIEIFENSVIEFYKQVASRIKQWEEPEKKQKRNVSDIQEQSKIMVEDTGTDSDEFDSSEDVRSAA